MGPEGVDVFQRLQTWSEQGNPLSERIMTLRRRLEGIEDISDDKLGKTFRWISGKEEWIALKNPQVLRREAQLYKTFCGLDSDNDVHSLFKPHKQTHIYEGYKMVDDKEPLSKDAVDRIGIVTELLCAGNGKRAEILRKALIIACRKSGFLEGIRESVRDHHFDLNYDIRLANRGKVGYVESGEADTALVQPFIDAYVPLLVDTKGNALPGDSILEAVIAYLEIEKPKMEEVEQAPVKAELVEAPTKAVAQPSEVVSFDMTLMMQVLDLIRRGGEEAEVDRALTTAKLTPEQRVMLLQAIGEVLHERPSEETRLRAEEIAPAPAGVEIAPTQVKESEELAGQVEYQEAQTIDYATLYRQAQEEIARARAELERLQQRPEPTSESVPSFASQLEVQRDLYRQLEKIEGEVSTITGSSRGHERLTYLKRQVWERIGFLEAETTRSTRLSRLVAEMRPDVKASLIDLVRRRQVGDKVILPITEALFSRLTYKELDSNPWFAQVLKDAKSSHVVAIKGDWSELDTVAFRKLYTRQFIAPAVLSFLVLTAPEPNASPLSKHIYECRSIFADQAKALGDKLKTSPWSIFENPESWIVDLMRKAQAEPEFVLDERQQQMITNLLDDITTIITEGDPNLLGSFRESKALDFPQAIASSVTRSWSDAATLSEYRTYMALGSFLLEVSRNPARYEIGRYISNPQ